MSITKASLIDLNGQELILDADADTSITADTDDRIDIKVAGSDTIHITSTGLGVGTNNPQSLLHLSSTSPKLSFTDTNSFSDTNDRFIIRASSDQGNIQYYDDSASATRTLMSFLLTEVNVNDDAADRDFRVESNLKSSMFVVDAGADAVIIGGGTSENFLSESHELQVNDTNFSVASFGTYRNGSDGATLSLGHSRNGTINSHTVLNDDDTMGLIMFYGSDGTDFARGASIQAAVDGTPGNNDMPGRLVFSTTADGADSPTEKMRIESHGTVSFPGEGGSYGFSIPYDQNMGYTNNLNAGGFSILHRNDRDCYLVGNAYYYRTGGVASWKAKFGIYKSNVISMVDGRINFQASNTAVSANSDLVNLATRASIDSDGLKFGTDTAAANALDDYEEGNWTPTFACTGATFNHDTQTGKYTKIGNMVSFTCLIGTDSVSGSIASNAISITGLPFGANNAYSGATGLSYSWGSSVANTHWSIGTGDSFISLYQPNNGASYVTGSFFGTGGNANRLWITGHYYTNS